MGQRPLMMRNVKEQRPRWRLISNAARQHITVVTHVTASFWTKKKEISACHYLPIVRSSTSLLLLIQFSSFYKKNLTDFGRSAQSISSLTGSFSRNGNA